MFSLKKKNNPLVDLKEDNKENSEERLFFHDIINHTHGLLLFLNQKVSLKEGMSASEVEMIKVEIKTLQSIVRDQYSFQHKNLIHSYEWVTFEHAFKACQTMISTYFANIEVKFEMIFKGDIALECTPEVQDKNLIYYPAFYRIMNNLIKNMAEAEACEIKFTFEINECGFFIETENAMKASLQKDLPEYLARVILNEKKQTLSGLGLDSIDHTASNCGGSFSFEIHNQIWVNKIFLPVKNKLLLEKVIKKSA